MRFRLTEPEKFNAENVYYQLATGELEKSSGVLSHGYKAVNNSLLGMGGMQVSNLISGYLNASPVA